MKKLLLFILLFIGINSYSHTLNKTQLVLEKHEKGYLLTVRFKTNHLLEAVYLGYPELKNKGLNTKEFKTKASEYFNETINFGRKNSIYLSEINYNFGGSHSTARFNVDGLRITASETPLEIRSFFEVDAHMFHDLTVISNGKYSNYEFTETQQSNNLSQNNVQGKGNFTETIKLLVLIFLTILLIFGVKKLVLLLQHRYKSEIA